MAQAAAQTIANAYAPRAEKAATSRAITRARILVQAARAAGFPLEHGEDAILVEEALCHLTDEVRAGTLEEAEYDATVEAISPVARFLRPCSPRQSSPVRSTPPPCRL